MQLWRLGILKSFDADFNGILMIFVGHVVWLYIYIYTYIFMWVWYFHGLTVTAMSFERFQIFLRTYMYNIYIYIIIIIYIYYMICLFIYFIMQHTHEHCESPAFCLENHVEIPRLQRHGAWGTPLLRALTERWSPAPASACGLAQWIHLVFCMLKSLMKGKYG